MFGEFVDKNSEEELKTEKAVLEFAKKVSGVLLKEGRKKHIQEFVKEVLQQVYPSLTSLEYEDINSKSRVLFNQKQKEEKASETKGSKKKPKAPAVQLKTTQKTAQLMGYDDDDIDDDGDYNANDDFMWDLKLGK